MSDTAGQKKRLIFIIEDNAVYAKSLELYLRTRFEDVEVTTFPVGELCLDNLHLNPDLIVTDYELNTRFFDAENGISILKEIKSRNPKLDVLVLTSKTDEELIHEVKETGCIYLEKNSEAFKKIENLFSMLVLNKLNPF